MVDGAHSVIAARREIKRIRILEERDPYEGGEK
jgi:hypothetical protein